LSIFRKQLIPSIIIVILALFLFTVFVIGQLSNYDRSLTVQNLVRSANLVSTVLGPSLTAKDAGQVQDLVARLGEKSGIRITVIDKYGVILGDSDKNPKEMENHSERPEIKEAINGRTGESIRYSNTLQQELFYIAVPVLDRGGNVDYIVRTSLPLSILQQTILPIEKRIIYLSLILATIVVVLLFALSKSLTKSLNSIINISEELAHGNLSVDIPISEQKGEIPKISIALNQMARRLNGLFKQLSSEKNQLEAILSAMSEAVLVLSQDGKAIITNNALLDMFNIKDDPEKKPYWEILRNREVTEVIENVLSERRPDTKEIFYLYPEERYYLLNVIPLESPEKEVIVVMFDITDFKRLEKIKADFIANVSHELRTPLTAIKGYSETLEEGAYENTEDLRHFIGIIKRHTDRLINIVSDLLVLSEVESRDYLSGTSPDSDFEWIDVDEVITSSLESIKNKASEKGLTVSFNNRADHHNIKGNRFLLEQMFLNLIDNAVKYTPDAGTIGIELSNPEGELNIRVFDTGIGIPKEHLPRIFERFYRVDKTRSRKIGGTGLGLSIVKHIVILHGGTVEVESEVGKGSSFTITLPQ
jgi:two-component system, OmpR family, phosphate regulon sensor histidine kinase PhoR